MRPRVLVIFPGALGDLICLGPVLRVLARRYGAADLELMARGELADFAVRRMAVARGHSIDRPEVGLLFSAAADAALRARSFFIQFSAIHSFFGADNDRYREVLGAACPGPVLFHRFRPDGEGHVSAGYLREVGAEAETAVSCRVDLPADDLVHAARAIQGLGLAGPPILLLPGSGSPAKNWPPASFASLGRALGGDRVIVVIGPAEAAIEREFAGFATLRQPTLGCLAGLARQSQAFVGNDSGVSHLAAAAGARGVVIFGPTDPARWRPSGEIRVCRRLPLAELSWQEVAAALGELDNGESGPRVC